MYELTCPSCQHVTSASFVRVGAVVDCAACGHRYRIADAHVNRRVPPPAASAKDGEPTFAQTMATAASSKRVKPDGSVVGLSGLSEMMRQVGDAPSHGNKSKPDAEMTPPPAAAVTSALSSSRIRLNRMRQRVKQRKMQSLYILGTILMVTLVFVVGVVYLFSFSRSASDIDPELIAGGTNSTGSDAHGNEQVNGEPLDPSHPDHPAIVSELPILTGQLWPMQQWQEIQEPYEPEQILIPPAWLSDISRMIDTDGVQRYTASLVTDQPGILVELEMAFSLVNPQGTELARTYIPVGPITVEQPQMIRLTLPQVWLNQGGLPTPGTVRVVERFASNTAGFLKAEVRETRMQRGVVRHRIRVKNTLDRVVHQTVIIITGIDSRSKPVARWRVDWLQTIPPDEYAQFWVELDSVDERWQILTWSLDVVGRMPEPIEMPEDESEAYEINEVDPMDTPAIDPFLDPLHDEQDEQELLEPRESLQPPRSDP